MKKKHIFVVLTVLMTAFIFWNSARPAVESANASGKFVDLLNKLLSFFKVQTNYDTMQNIVRKAAHIAEFALHAMLLTGCFTGKLKKRLIYIFFFGLLTGCIDEYIQLFADGRAGLVTDIFIDFGGTVVGTGILGLSKKVR